MTATKTRETQWHILVRYLHQQRVFLPTHKLQSIDTDFGFIGSSGEQRVRELARNDPKVITLHPELKDRVERQRGAAIGLDARYEFFRWKPGVSRSDMLKAAAERVRRFDANLPASEVFA